MPTIFHEAHSRVGLAGAARLTPAVARDARQFTVGRAARLQPQRACRPFRTSRRQEVRPFGDHGRRDDPEASAAEHHPDLCRMNTDALHKEQRLYAALAENGSKDAEYIATLMIALIRALPHPRYLYLIITDGAGDMDMFKRLMHGRRLFLDLVQFVPLAPVQLCLRSRGERRADQDAHREGEDDRRPVRRLKTLRTLALRGRE